MIRKTRDTVARRGRRGRVVHVVAAASVTLGLSLTVLAAGGCEAIAAIAYSFQGGKPVKKRFALQPVRTLVMVDVIERPDRQNVLRTSTLRNAIASDIAYYLEREGGLPEGMTVPLRELYQLEAELGDDYARTPVDRIGHRLEAKQVVYVLVEQATLLMGGNVYRPTAVAQVKVIDVEQGRRTFPDAAALTPDRKPPPGYGVTVEMEPVTREATDRVAMDLLRRNLASKLALDVSRLFYDWREADLGSQIQ